MFFECQKKTFWIIQFIFRLLNYKARIFFYFYSCKVFKFIVKIEILEISQCLSKISAFFSTIKTKNWNFSSNLFVSKKIKFIIKKKFKQIKTCSNKLLLSLEFLFKLIVKIFLTANFSNWLKIKNTDIKIKNNNLK